MSLLLDGADNLDLEETEQQLGGPCHRLPLQAPPDVRQRPLRPTDLYDASHAASTSLTLQPSLARAQDGQRCIPGPAGQGCHRRPFPSAAGTGAATDDTDFLSAPWLAALQMLDMPDFDEHHPLLRGGTVSTAHGMQVSGVLDRLLVYVVSVQRAYNGECFISLKDPTGSIGGTLTADVLEAEPDVRRGSVVLLQKVAVLRTPPPCVLHHLCITGNCIGQVIPAASMHGGSTSLHVSNPTVPMLPAAQSGLEAATSQQIVSNATGQVLSNRANHAAPMLRNPLPKSAMHAVAQATPTAAPGCLHNGIDDLLSGLDGEFDL